MLIGEEHWHLCVQLELDQDLLRQAGPGRPAKRSCDLLGQHAGLVSRGEALCAHNALEHGHRQVLAQGHRE